ncbi:uncharacterized protein LOC131648562 [Vicia villosa]|uniref:uncharacterized protein LOC131648562 n=1 Tax=Vicia villosa TaxID=3911 RepID=UPI00273CE1FB|nr:uncharacterized protein LOC131648562 [Vicia villosa]
MCSLLELFPDLYAQAAEDGMSVAEAGVWTSGNGWEWRLDRVLQNTSSSSTASSSQSQLLDFLDRTALSVGSDDVFRWKLNKEEVFSVSSCYYRFFSKLSGPPILPSVVKDAYFICKIDAPSKTLLFGWRLIHDRLATKDHLFMKGILDITEIN